MIGMALAVVLALAATVAGIFAWHNQQLAEDQRQRAERNLAAVTGALAVLNNETDPKKVAEIFFSLAHNYLSEERYDEAVTLYNRSLTLAVKQFGNESAEVASTRTQVGLVYAKMEKYADATPVLEEALHYHERTATTDHENYAAIVRVLKGIYVSGGNFTEAEALASKVQQITLSRTAKVVPVFYATDRKRNMRSDRVAYSGVNQRPSGCLRQIHHDPNTHKIAKIERPWSLQIPHFNLTVYEEPEDPSRHFTLQEVKALVKDEFINRTRRWVAASGRYKDHAVVYVPGFNTKFDTALYRAANLAYSLNFEGAPFVYSWPSAAQLTAYTLDRENAMQAVPYLTKFLQLVLERTGASKVSIIAYAMGTAPVLAALRELRSSVQRDLKFEQIIFVAPDADRDHFTYAARGVVDIAQGVTLYASASDRALEAARAIYGSPRAGDVASSSLTLVDGIDTIDVTAVGTKTFGSHSVLYDDDAVLLQDIGRLLRTGERPPDRRSPNFQRVEMENGSYWRYHGASADPVISPH